MTERPPDEARRFAGNAAWLLVGDAVAKLAGFVFMVLAARTLTRTDFGYFTFALSFVPLFLVFSAWGLDDILFREVARSRERVSELFASTFVPRAVLVVAALVAALVAGSFFVPGPEQIATLALIGLSLALDELGSAVGTVFKAFEKMRYRALRILVNRLISTALAVVAVIFGADLLLVCLIYLAGSVGSFVFAWVALRRHFPPIHFADRRRERMRELLTKGLPLGLSGLLGVAALRIDTVMLQGFRGAVAVALYGIAFRFLDSFLFVAWGLANVALPRMVRSQPRDAGQTFELVLALCLAFYLPIAVIGGFAGEWLVTSIFGDRYAPAGAAVVWLAAAGLFYGAGYLARMGCLSLGRRSAIAWGAFVALVVNVGLNVVAIPRYGFEGAAVVTLITGAIEALYLGVVYVTANRTIRVRRTLLVPILASAVMWGTLLLGELEDAAALAVGAAIYVAALFLLGRFLAGRDVVAAIRSLRRGSSPAGAEAQ